MSHISGGQLALLGFGLIALFGTFLLMLPVSSAQGVWTGFIDALFTAVSAVCVTGLITVPTGTYWSIFGQTVIILLIEIGGLGFMTFMTMFAVATGKRISIHDRLLIQSSINSDEISGIVKFVKKIIYYALIIEVVGALCLCAVFVPRFGVVRGVYFAFWHAISMYCNAGFDLMASVGESSFMGYVDNSWLNLIVCLLIIIGGLGFSVYVDLLDYRHRRKLTLHTKIVLITTALLIFGGALLFYIFERDNPGTMGNLPWYGKLNASFFQSVTPRTAGANTIDQAKMTAPSLALTDMFMFVGASPGSTGGGMKTTTLFVIILTMWTVLMGKKDVNIMRRRITRDTIFRALSVFIISILVLCFVFIILLMNEPNTLPDYLLFELLSAYNTVGLSCGITSGLSVISKIALTACMFVGRVGPLTIAYVLTNTEDRMRRNQGHYRLPPGNILIG